MTSQEIFDKVCMHLMKQKAQAFNRNYACAYLALDGKQCAVGCLIEPEHYSAELEHQACDTQPVLEALHMSLGHSPPMLLLMSLQRIHDGTLPYLWAGKLVEIAKLFNLKANFMIFNTRVNGIPCQCRVVLYKPTSSKKVGDLTEFEYSLYDRKGYIAKWLDRYVTPSVDARLQQEFEERFA
jgi:hypothetical protein